MRTAILFQWEYLIRSRTASADYKLNGILSPDICQGRGLFLCDCRITYLFNPDLSEHCEFCIVNRSKMYKYSNMPYNLLFYTIFYE